MQQILQSSSTGFEETKTFTRRIYNGQNAKTRIVSVIAKSKNPLNIDEIVKATSVLKETVRRNLGRLKGQKLIESKVVNKKAVYTIVD